MSETLDFTQHQALGNKLLQRLDELREEEAITWNNSMNGWLVLRHEDVTAGFQGVYPLSCVRMEAKTFAGFDPSMLERYPTMMGTLPNWIVNSDPPRHTRLRKLMTRAFSRRVVDGLRPYAREIIRQVLDGIAQRQEIEFVDDVARAITGRVILRIFGLPETHLAQLQRWASAINTFGSVAPTPEILADVEACLAEMAVVFKAEIGKRMEAPSDDFLSLLVSAHDGSDSLTTEEILGLCYLSVNAGHDTTLNTMSLGVAAVIEDEAARRFLLENPERSLECVLEINRHVAMATSFHRIAMADFEWRGAQIKQGDIVHLVIAAANRDPRIFGAAEDLDMERPNNEKIMTFGSGIHHCIGHLLAKMQLEEFFTAFFAKFPNPTLLDASFHFQPSIGFRGLEQLRIGLAGVVS
jgi:pimeloyl-[acyl-carrier protein] synthase